MSNRPPEPPPIDYDDFAVSDDLFLDNYLSALPISDKYGYDPAFADDPFAGDVGLLFTDVTSVLPASSASYERGESVPFTTPAPDDDGWSWYEARLVGIEKEADDGITYEIGCMDVYADVNTGDLGASYLPIASFEDVDLASAFYHDLQGDIHDNGTPIGDIPKFAEDAARRFNSESPAWRGATDHEYAAYETLRDLELPDRDYADDPPEHAIDDLIQTAAELGGVAVERDPAPDIEDRSAFKALADIGIDADGFDPAKDPPPFYDAETGTAYWIGVFQPDQDDLGNCLTSILSLGRNAETGEMEAQLAPCVPGDWDKTYGAAEFLIDVAQRGGIENCFDAAEGMALATEQRDLWETPLGLPLEPDAAQNIADYTRDEWEIDL